MAKVSYNNPNKVYPITLEECEGFTNKPTWIFNLWVNNEESLYKRYREDCVGIIQTVVDGTTLAYDRESAIIRGTADLLEEWARNYIYSHWSLNVECNTLISDLVLYTLHLVDWIELAEYAISDYLEEISFKDIPELVAKCESWDEEHPCYPTVG